jgi:prophage regulatory protein
MARGTLASLRDVAGLLAVPKRTAARYVNRPDFPEPIDKLGVGRVWRRSDVTRWGRKHLPLQPGRPPKRKEK